ncbi:MAG: Flagellar FliJ protein [Candidatus Atribacteria bacterium]|nr:Flagellar FliJ protein [Candidatus Atribacteria bacterium]
MNGYQFKLQKVLDTRKIRQELIETKLVELERLAGSQKEHLKLVLHQREKMAVERSEERQTGEIVVDTEVFYQQYLEVLTRKAEEIKRYLFELEERIKETKKELLQASMERKIVEKLKDKDYQSFVLDLERNNQKQLDEVAIQSFRRDKK